MDGFAFAGLTWTAIEGWRAGSFLLGLFFIWLAVASPMAALDHELLTVHMVQHLLLMTLAPPLIWLGAPVKPLTAWLCRSDSCEAFIAPLSRSAPMQRLGKSLAHPAVCWLAAAATLVGWHIPALFMLGMRSEMWHAIEQASFLVSGLLFWWPVIQPVAERFELARVVDPFVSFSRHLAVRYPFRISCLLRPRGLSGLFLVTAPARLFCSRGPAMCRRVDVDLRHRRLSDRRNDCRSAVTLAPEASHQYSLSDIGLATQRGIADDSAAVWRLSKCPASLLLPCSMRPQ